MIGKTGRMFLLLVMTIACSAAAAHASRAQSGADAADADVERWRLQRLDLDLTISPEKQSMTASGKARLRLEGGPSLGPTLGLGGQSRWTNAAAQGATAQQGTMQLPSGPVREVPVMRLRFASPQAAGTEIEVTFEFHTTGAAFQFAVKPEGALASWTASWYPRTREQNAAPGVTRLRVPRNWRALSNGRLTSSVEEGGERVETWQASHAVARSFIAGPYHVTKHALGDREVGLYLLTPTDRAQEYVKALEQTMRALSERFGPYPYESFFVAEVPENLVTWYGSSEQGFINTKTGGFQYRSGYLPLFGHEMAHSWWGNWVQTRAPAGLMTGEALAQFGAVLAIEAIEGPAAATEFLRFSGAGYSAVQCARGFFEMWRNGKVKPLMQVTSGADDHNLSDAKGHWVYQMLRHKMGDERFFAVMRGLRERFAGQRMSLADLREAFVKAGPADLDLATFFEQWLDQPGAPILEMEWAREPGAGNKVRVTVRQKGPAYDLPLELVTLSAGGEKTHTVRLTKQEQTFVLEAGGEPKDVQLDPRHRILRWTPEYGPQPQ